MPMTLMAKNNGHRDKMVANIVKDVDTNEEDENYELMQVYLMAKAMKYSQWVAWLEKFYKLTPNPLK